MDEKTWSKLEEFLKANNIPYESKAVSISPEKSIYEIHLPFVTFIWR